MPDFVKCFCYVPAYYVALISPSLGHSYGFIYSGQCSLSASPFAKTILMIVVSICFFEVFSDPIIYNPFENFPWDLQKSNGAYNFEGSLDLYLVLESILEFLL